MPRRSELRITKRTVYALTVGEKDTVFWDRDLAGFGVRVHATGRKTYVVQSRGPTGPKRVTLGLHGDLSADECGYRESNSMERPILHALHPSERKPITDSDSTRSRAFSRRPESFTASGLKERAARDNSSS